MSPPPMPPGHTSQTPAAPCHQGSSLCRITSIGMMIVCTALTSFLHRSTVLGYKRSWHLYNGMDRVSLISDPYHHQSETRDNLLKIDQLMLVLSSFLHMFPSPVDYKLVAEMKSLQYKYQLTSLISDTMIDPKATSRLMLHLIRCASSFSLCSFMLQFSL